MALKIRMFRLGLKCTVPDWQAQGPKFKTQYYKTKAPKRFLIFLEVVRYDCLVEVTSPCASQLKPS
jgi:hypothetical protein